MPPVGTPQGNLTGLASKKAPLGQRNYGAAVGILVPEVKGQLSLLGAIFADLRNRGFSNLGGPEQPFPQGGVITNLGIEFLNFVLSPEDRGTG